MPTSLKTNCKNFIQSANHTPPSDQKAQSIIHLANLLNNRNIHYNENYQGKGSMTDPTHTKASAVTEVVVQTILRGIPLTLTGLEQMSEEQLEAYFDQWLRRKCYNIQWRNGHLNGSYMRRLNDDSPTFARQHTSTEWIDSNGDMQSCSLTADYTPTMEEAEQRALIETFDLIEVATLTAALNKPELLLAFPKITIESLIKYLMYKSGKALKGKNTIASPYLNLLDLWWRWSGLDRSIYYRWLLELNSLQALLNTITGKHSKHIKDAILEAFNPPDGNRESLRRGLNHVNKGIHFLNLTIWITLCSPADDYQDEFVNLTSNLIKPARQVISKKEEHRTFSAKATYDYTASLIEPNTLIRKADLRPLLSMLQHDQEFHLLTQTKANSIRQLVDYAFTLSEEVGHYFDGSDLKKLAPIKWRK